MKVEKWKILSPSEYFADIGPDEENIIAECVVKDRAEQIVKAHNEAIDQLTEAPCDCQDKPEKIIHATADPTLEKINALNKSYREKYDKRAEKRGGINLDNMPDRFLNPKLGSQTKPDGCTVLPQSVADEHTAEVNSAFNDGAILGMEEGRKEAMFWIQFGPPLPEVPVK